MKRFRLVDLPLIAKIGFAPAFALVMLALTAGGAVIIQRGQAADLTQVVHTDLPNSLRLQKVSERITAVHGQLYFLLTHQAASIEVEKIEGESQAMLTETYRLYPPPTPLNAPPWFDCFDAPAIDRALRGGEAIAFLSEPDILPGVDRVVAVFADGRAYAWHQLHPEDQ